MDITSMQIFKKINLKSKIDIFNQTSNLQTDRLGFTILCDNTYFSVSFDTINNFIHDDISYRRLEKGTVLSNISTNVVQGWTDEYYITKIKSCIYIYIFGQQVISIEPEKITILQKSFNYSVFNSATLSIYGLVVKGYKDPGFHKNSQLLYSTNIPMWSTIHYNFEILTEDQQPFDRICYFMFLEDSTGSEFWTSVTMNAFTSDVKILKIGALNNIRQTITGIEARSNVMDTIYSQVGIIENFSNNYIPNALFPMNKIILNGKYGSLQIHTLSPNYPNSTTILSYNNFNGNPDIGIGSNFLGLPDWTFSSNGHTYKTKKIEIYSISCPVCELVTEAKSMRLLQSSIVNNVHSIEEGTFTRVGYYIAFGADWLWISFNINDVSHIQTVNNVFSPSTYTLGVDLDVNISKIEIKSTFNSSVKSTNLRKNLNEISFSGICTISENVITLKSHTKSQCSVQVFVNYVAHIPDFTVLLTGQSNSQGLGGSFEQHSIDDSPSRRILSWNLEETKWEIANLSNKMGSKPAGWQCFAFHFAKQWIKNNDGKIGIIVFGMSNQHIGRWTFQNLNLPFSQDPSKIDSGDIFLSCINHINKSTKKIDAILWHQGESDWYETFTYYHTRLYTVINQYRTFLKDTSLPFIAGQLANTSHTAAQNHVLSSLNFDIDNNTRCANTESLQTYDVQHFNTQSHRTMGRMYYDAYISISSKIF
jgi:hypothetical protein